MSQLFDIQSKFCTLGGFEKQLKFTGFKDIFYSLILNENIKMKAFFTVFLAISPPHRHQHMHRPAKIDSDRYWADPNLVRPATV